MNWSDALLYNIRYKKFSASTSPSRKLVDFGLDSTKIYPGQTIEKNLSVWLNGELSIGLTVFSSSNIVTAPRVTAKYQISIIGEDDNIIKSQILDVASTSGYYETSSMSFAFPVNALKKYRVKIEMLEYGTAEDGIIQSFGILGNVIDIAERYIRGD